VNSLPSVSLMELVTQIKKPVNSEKVTWGEKTVNKFIEMVLSRIINAERLQVRVKASLKQLARGELDALAIDMFGFLLRRSLRVTEFRFDITAAAVDIQTIMRQRQIELLHPSEGSLRMVISQEQLTEGLNAQLVSASDEQVQLKQVNCELGTDGAIAFHFDWISAGEMVSGSCTTTPRINPNGDVIVLDQWKVEEKEPPVELVKAVMTQVSDILSLKDIANQGTAFNFQQIDIEAGNITVRATTHIDQFPSA